MQTLNYWKQFEKSGRIEDYLTYVKNQEEEKNPSPTEQTGENPYAGIRNSNGNHIEANAYR